VEIRARYLLIGLFVVAVALAGAGFIYWLSNAGGLGQRVTYRIDFNGSVAGLSRGSAVQFNGITVGEVTDLQLVADRPNAVMATISIDKATPLRADTHVGLDFGGLTGAATVALRGGGNLPVPTANDGGSPILMADPSALKGMTQAARDVLGQLSVVIDENAASLRAAIANIDTFSDALSRNSDKVDGILQGLARLTGGGEAKAQPILYDLSAPRSFPAIPALPAGQLAVATPTAVVALDTQRVLQRSADGDVPVFEGAQWADSIPLLFQARIIQSFENANYLRVAAASDTFTGDYRLLVDIRKFRLVTTPSPTGEVEFSAKIVGGDGKVIDGRIFSATVPAATADEPGAVKALGGAFDKAATDLVVWTLATMPAS
jgi:phospholipid/cholesterol/gamma-HCH transport system substrate-binding protein